MPPRKASVPKQQRGPSTTTTSTKHISTSGITNTEKCLNTYGKNKENNKAGSTISH